MNFGQATGLAAALAASEGIEPRDLDVKNLQQSLLRTPDITLVKNVTLHVHQMIGQVSAPGLAVVPTNPRLKSCALLTFLYAEGITPYSPGFASLSELPWVTGLRVPLTPKGLRPYVVCPRPQIIWAQPLRGRRCSTSEPRVARKASQPWAVRRNAFGIKKDLIR